MKKQILLSVLILVLSALTLFSQDNLKSMICVVTPQYPTDIKVFYGEYGRALAREGCIKSGALLRMMGNGGF